MYKKKNSSHTERWQARQPHKCPESARWDVSGSDPPKKTHTPPDRTVDRPDSARTGQYSGAGMGGSWPGSAVTSNHSASQGSDSLDSDVVGVPDGLNLYLR